MRVGHYADAARFLDEAQPALEACGPEADLLLGMCLRMAAQPACAGTPLRFLAVLDGHTPILLAVHAPPWSMVVHALPGDLDAAARTLADNLPAGCPPVPGVEGPAPVASLVAARLAQASHRQTRLVRRQLLCELRAVRTPVPAVGRLRIATQADAPLVAQWWHGSSLATFGSANLVESERSAQRYVAQGDLYLWEVARPVSMAVKTAPTPAGITVARVFTPPEERRNGYAAACVSELSRRLLAEGHAYCTLMVDVANAPARRLYERIGYRTVCQFLEIALDE